MKIWGVLSQCVVGFMPSEELLMFKSIEEVNKIHVKHVTHYPYFGTVGSLTFVFSDGTISPPPSSYQEKWLPTVTSQPIYNIKQLSFGLSKEHYLKRVTVNSMEILGEGANYPVIAT